MCRLTRDGENNELLIFAVPRKIKSNLMSRPNLANVHQPFNCGLYLGWLKFRIAFNQFLLG